MFKVLAEAYAEAMSDGQTAAAELILEEMEAIAGLAEVQRIETEKARNWRVG